MWEGEQVFWVERRHCVDSSVEVCNPDSFHERTWRGWRTVIASKEIQGRLLAQQECEVRNQIAFNKNFLKKVLVTTTMVDNQAEKNHHTAPLTVLFHYYLILPAGSLDEQQVCTCSQHAHALVMGIIWRNNGWRVRKERPMI
ncbi:hypothetical protein CHARACLAT_013053 [Characodon lateralis]|uniref:Uncharacterized protein n=1 Tax=Characodon lateralis TaxID=208331 RepID=A0ABU7CMT4_9TELE|nr:hypothetical protein [Characodon lateralis]